MKGDLRDIIYPVSLVTALKMDSFKSEAWYKKLASEAKFFIPVIVKMACI